MNFLVESGELALNVKENDHHLAALQALKVWHVAEERIHLCGVLTVKKLGPRGGKLDEKMFSTTTVLEELDFKYIVADGEVISMPKTRPEIEKVDDVVSNRWLSLRRAHYQWPGEKPKTWEFVTRPSRKGKTDAVVVVPLMKNPNRLIVVNEFRVPINDYEIGFPAGLIDDGESPADAAHRELREETGLNLDRILLVSPPLYTSAGLTDENVVLVFCECSGEIIGVNSVEEKVDVFALELKDIDAVLKEPPCLMSARLWPVLQMLSQQGFVGLAIN